MNGYERILGMLDGRTVDRIPFMPVTMMLAAAQIGVSYREYATDYRRLVEGQIATAKKFHFDYVSSISDPGREAADLGATIRFFDNQPPAIDETNALLHDKSVLKTLKIADPQKTGSRMFDRVQAVKLFAEKVKGEYLIEGWVEGPCAESADLRGINQLMMDFMLDRDFVLELFEFVTENAIGFAKAQVEAGADLIGVGDAAASLVGPKIYEELVLPFEQRLIKSIHEMGAKVRLHICGNTNRITALMAQTGTDFVDLDSMVDIKLAREAMGEKQVIAGNIDPVKILKNGTPELVIEKLAECANAAGKNYIVGAGCEVPIGTPEANIKAMYDFITGACS